MSKIEAFIPASIGSFFVAALLGLIVGVETNFLPDYDYTYRHNMFVASEVCHSSHSFEAIKLGTDWYWEAIHN